MFGVTCNDAGALVAVADPGPVRPAAIGYAHHGGHGGFHGHRYPGGYGGYGGGHYRHWWPWRW